MRRTLSFLFVFVVVGWAFGFTPPPNNLPSLIPDAVGMILIAGSSSGEPPAGCSGSWNEVTHTLNNKTGWTDDEETWQIVSAAGLAPETDSYDYNQLRNDTELTCEEHQWIAYIGEDGYNRQGVFFEGSSTANSFRYGALLNGENNTLYLYKTEIDGDNLSELSTASCTEPGWDHWKGWEFINGSPNVTINLYDLGTGAPTGGPSTWGTVDCTISYASQSISGKSFGLFAYDGGTASALVYGWETDSTIELIAGSDGE